MSTTFIKANVASISPVRFSQAGNPTLTVRVGENRGQGDRRTTKWHNITVVGKGAVAVLENVLKVGDFCEFKVADMETREWEDRDGQARKDLHSFLQAVQGITRPKEKDGKRTHAPLSFKLSVWDLNGGAVASAPAGETSPAPEKSHVEHVEIGF